MDAADSLKRYRIEQFDDTGSIRREDNCLVSCADTTEQVNRAVAIRSRDITSPSRKDRLKFYH